MPRIARTVAIGYPHHVTQRGNYRQPVFESEVDYRQYLKWLAEYSKRYELKIWAYCLMGNHIHYVCVPMKEDSMSLTFNTLHMRYSQFVNRKKKATGHLWQGRFFSCVLDERHLYSALRYVENNPVRAGFVETAELYLWSSARGHCNKVNDSILSQDLYLLERIQDWPAYLMELEDEQVTDEIRKKTRTGRPCGEDSFLQEIELLIGRGLKALPRGRPRKGD